MRKLFSVIIAMAVMVLYSGCALAVNETPQQQQARLKQAKLEQMMKNAKPIELAFVFDGPSDKNMAVLKTFQTTITRSLLN